MVYFKKRTFILAATLGLSGDLLAAGFRLLNQDAEAFARGNAFTATADNPSAIFYNPAGITQLEGHQLSIGGLALSAGFDYTSALGDTASADSAFQFAPQIYYTYSPVDSRFSYGVGLFTPFGLVVDYGRDTTFPTLAIDGELTVATVNPTLAYQITPQFSVGVGLALNYSEISISRSLGFSPGDEFSVEGDGFSTGFNAGALWQASDEWSFGLNFRSSSKINYSGDSRATGFATTSTDASLRLPKNIALGASYRPNKKWNFEAGIDWTDWDDVNQITLDSTPFGDVSLPFNFESGFMYQLGVTRNFDRGYFLSAGYIYSENASPDLNFSPLIPDANLHLWTVGVGRRTEQSGWALTYAIAYNGGRDVSGSSSSSLIGESADGTYETLNHAINLAYRFSF
ncbi:outer membrane protein transport protein [Verrucomicrobiaceae bacterium 227]